LASVLAQGGKRVGLYTSPHYRDFRERIKIDGEYISEDYVVDFVGSSRKWLSEFTPSFFELTVAMAFSYFRDCAVDVAVIETGLGGRLDSTNIVHPILSVITNIDLDHVDMLGDSRYSIAYEKAGIIKNDIPVVIGRYQPSCDHIFMKKSRTTNSPISFADLNWSISSEGNVYRFPGSNISLEITPPLHFPFITENIITCLESLRVLNDLDHFQWEDRVVSSGIERLVENTNYMGRWQVLGHEPLIIADSAHNEAAIERVIREIVSYGKRCHFVLGFSRDKPLSKILSFFPRDAHYYFSTPAIERGMDIEILINEAGKAVLLSWRRSYDPPGPYLAKS
jgi:dihydrofolate synthase/folylpolyglutamate synthase